MDKKEWVCGNCNSKKIRFENGDIDGIYPPGYGKTITRCERCTFSLMIARSPNDSERFYIEWEAYQANVRAKRPIKADRLDKIEFDSLRSIPHLTREIRGHAGWDLDFFLCCTIDGYNALHKYVEQDTREMQHDLEFARQFPLTSSLWVDILPPNYLELKPVYHNDWLKNQMPRTLFNLPIIRGEWSNVDHDALYLASFLTYDRRPPIDRLHNHP